MAFEPNKAFVFIGRFQPLHAGHARVIQKAFDDAQTLLVLVGSSFGERSHRNPFTYEQREDMIINQFLPYHKEKRLIIAPLRDIEDDDLWVSSVRQTVMEKLSPTYLTEDVSLIGHNKDSTSYYLSLFPEFGFVDVAYDDKQAFSATDIRNALYTDVEGDLSEHPITPYTKEFLVKFRQTAFYRVLAEQHKQLVG